MLTPEKIIQARQSVAQGIEIKEIALAIGTTDDTIARYTKDVKQARKKAYMDAIEVLSDCQLFLTHQAIAKILGLARSTVTRIASMLNLPNSLDYSMPKGISKEDAKAQVEMLETKRKQAILKAQNLIHPDNILNRCQNSTPETTRKPARDWNEMNQEIAWKEREIEAEKDSNAHLELLLVSERQENEEITEKLEETTKENILLESRANELQNQNQELLEKIRGLEDKLQESQKQNNDLSKKNQDLAKKLDDAEKKLHEIAQQAEEQRNAWMERQSLPRWAMDDFPLWQSLQLLVQAWGQYGLVRKLQTLGIKISRAAVRTWLGVIHLKPLSPKNEAADAILRLANSFASQVAYPAIGVTVGVN